MRRLALAFTITFGKPVAARSYAISIGLGSLLTGFYLILLPAERLGGLSIAALQFLTFWLAAAALLLGYGFAVTLAMNVAAAGGNAGARKGSGALGLGGLVASLLPSSLCCTPVIPLALAAVGVSAPAMFRTTGRYQAFFAVHSGIFIGGSVLAVLLAMWFAAYNLTTPCSPKAPKGSHP